MLFSDLDETQDSESQVLAAAVARGARIRSISDSGFLALPGALKRIRRDVAAGEEARIFPELPFKMIVVDRRVGLIPLNVQDGIAFYSEITGAVNYHCIHLVTTAPSGFPTNVPDYAFDNSGAAITIP